MSSNIRHAKNLKTDKFVKITGDVDFISSKAVKKSSSKPKVEAKDSNETDRSMKKYKSSKSIAELTTQNDIKKSMQTLSLFTTNSAASANKQKPNIKNYNDKLTKK